MDEVWAANNSDIEALAAARHADPFAVLGPHLAGGGWAIRVYMPDAVSVQAVDERGLALATLQRRSGDFFEGLLPGATEPAALSPANRARRTARRRSTTPTPSVRCSGRWTTISSPRARTSNCMSASAPSRCGTKASKACNFAVWAPNAQRVSVVGDFNRWDGRRNPMRKRFGSGLWEVFLPQSGPGAIYKYEILGQRRRSHAAKGRSVGPRGGDAALHRLGRRLEARRSPGPTPTI